MNELELYIQSYFGVHQKDLKQLANLFETTHLKKDEYFTIEGKYCNKLSFIKSGHLRVFNYSKGKEITQWISSQGEFITDLASIIFDQPARWNIQAIEDCDLYTISGENYRNIHSIISSWDKLERLFIAKCFLTLEDRVYSFLSMTAEERYQHLFDYKPELFNLVPLHFIASMLGMTPETLSRIRRKSIS